MFKFPNKKMNNLNPIWYFCFLIQGMFYFWWNFEFSISKMLIMGMSTIESIIYAIVFSKYQLTTIENKDQQLGFFSFFTQVIPGSILNFLIALPYWVLFSQTLAWSKTSNLEFFFGMGLMGFATFLATAKFFQLIAQMPRHENLNAINLASVLCWLGVFLMNLSIGNRFTIFSPILNYFSLRWALGRGILFDAKGVHDFAMVQLPMPEILSPAGGADSQGMQGSQGNVKQTQQFAGGKKKQKA